MALSAVALGAVFAMGACVIIPTMAYGCPEGECGYDPDAGAVDAGLHADGGSDSSTFDASAHDSGLVDGSAIDSATVDGAITDAATDGADH